MMIFKKYLVLVWSILLASAAVAGDQARTHIKIAVDKDDAGEQTFMFDSEDAGFDLQSLAVGEARTLTDASGNVATILRTVDGLEVEVDGETVVIGGPDSEATANVFVQDDEHHGDAHIDKSVRKIKMFKTGDDDAVTIISGGAIDEATRQKIREALTSAGVDGEVEFIDGSEFDSGVRKEVRVIRKESDVTN